VPVQSPTGLLRNNYFSTKFGNELSVNLRQDHPRFSLFYWRDLDLDPMALIYKPTNTLSNKVECGQENN